LAPLERHAFETADHDDGQDDVLVLVGLELAAQALGGLPDVARQVVELRFIQRERHLARPVKGDGERFFDCKNSRFFNHRTSRAAATPLNLETNSTHGRYFI